MHVSDQTLIAVIHEAKATEFDLGTLAVSDLAVAGVSNVVVAAMRQSTVSANALAVPEQSPTAGVQTLAGAEAAAKLVKRSPSDTWRLGPSLGAPVPPASVSLSEGRKAEGTTTPTTTTAKDEVWWRTRMGGLRDQRATDKAACDPKVDLVARLKEPELVKLDRLPGGRSQKVFWGPAILNAQADADACTNLVARDNRMIADAEQEARAQNVLPGWLR
jgi:hypothetical protein